MNQLFPGLPVTSSTCDAIEGIETPAWENAADTTSICCLSSAVATSAGRLNSLVPTSATCPRTPSTDDGTTLPANVSTTSFKLRSLSDPASMLREGSVLSKNMASEDWKVLRVRVAAIPKLGMPSQSTPITRARLDNVIPSKVMEPTMSPEMNRPVETNKALTSNWTGCF